MTTRHTTGAAAPQSKIGNRKSKILPRLLSAILSAISLSTATAAPYIEYLYPAGAAVSPSPLAGSSAATGAAAPHTLEITLGGKTLEGAREVWISGEGVTGEVLTITQPTPAQINEAKKRDEVASQTARLRLTLAPDAAPGARDLRIMADAGLSNRFRFEIGRLPEVLETEPNNTHAQARALPPLPALPVTVNGQITNADRDHFRFHATAGEQLLLQVRARAIKPYLADAVPGWFQARMTLYDAATGKKIAEVDDYRFDPDPLLLWTVPATGDYIVEIEDALSRGREDLVYRLTLGRLPFVTDIFPLGSPPGPVTLAARGINLSGTTKTTATWRRDFTGQPPGAHLVGDDTTTPVPTNRLPFEIGELPEVLEKKEPNNNPRNSLHITSPVVINGRIEKPGDTDCYTFAARKGDRFILDVMARRLGSPLDAQLRLGPQKTFKEAADATEAAALAAGKPKPRRIGPPSSDDVKDERYGLVTHHADPRIDFTAPADGDYHLFIEDTQGQGGPEYAYRLRVAPPRPDFELRILPDNLSVPAGGNAVVQLRAFRMDGFDGPVTLHVEDLPAGFELGAATIPAGKNTALLTLAAPSDAPPGVYKPRFFAEADLPDPADGNRTRRVRHDVSAAEELMQAFFYTHTVPVAQSYLVVGPPAPFRVILQRPADADPLELPVDTDVEISIRVIREGVQKYKTPVRVTATRGGKGIIPTAASVAAGETDGVIKIRCTDPKRVGTDGVLVIEGTQRAKGQKITATAPALPFRVVPAPAPAPAPSG
ncbi:MAG: peptidase [Opitutaceae bacterium]|nr:peptidase [Opitutaceae bacterium]